MEVKVLAVGESVGLKKDDSSNGKYVGDSEQENSDEHHWLRWISKK